MDHIKYIKPDFPKEAFAGTATYYAQYRVPYPKALIDDLLKRAGVSGDGRLLDLACGPGRIAIPLASSFRDVWAIDLEPEMTEVGQQTAQQRGVTNIRWMVGKAEELEAVPDSFELITIGEAFHRLDQWIVAKHALRWLSPGHCLATMGNYHLTSGKEPCHRIVVSIARKWTARNSACAKISTRPRPGHGPSHNERVFRDVGFTDVESYPFVHPHVWTVDSIIGNLFSTSRYSKRILGEKVDDFEADLRRALHDHDQSGRYSEDMRFGYTLARKPWS